MVRVGGGWDTLEHYLDKHDPCRCSSTGQCWAGWTARSSSPWLFPSLTSCLYSSHSPPPIPAKGQNLLTAEGIAYPQPPPW